MFEHKNKRELEYKKTRSVLRKEERKIFFNKFYRLFYYFLLISFLAVLIYAVFFSPFLEITKIEISGIKTLDIEKISSALENEKNGKYFGIFPKKNLILFSSSLLQKNLNDNFKRIKKLEISKKFPDKIYVRIEERESLLLWCTPTQECFIMDEDGIAYAKISLDSREVAENNLIRINSDEQQRNINEGEKILTADRVEFLMKLPSDFGSYSGFEISGEIGLKSRMAEEVVLKTVEGKYIILNTEIPLDKSAKTLKIGIEKNTQSSVSMGDIEGFDLRVENRIYYKIKNQEMENEKVEEIVQ